MTPPPLRQDWNHKRCEGEYDADKGGLPFVPLAVSDEPCVCGSAVVKDPEHDHNPGAWFCLRTGDKWWWCQTLNDKPHPPGKHASRMQALYAPYNLTITNPARTPQEG